MAISLADAQKLTQDRLTMDVIDEFRKSDLMDSLIFDNDVALNGGSTLAYTYNRVTTNGTAAFRAINSEYTAQEAVTTQVTTNLKVFGGSFGIDRVIQKHVKGVTNQLAFQLSQKIQGANALFADTFFNGSVTADSKVFDGLNVILLNTSTEVFSSANLSAPLNLSTSSDIDSNYKVFLDKIDDMLAELDGAPTALAMNRKMRSVFNKVARRSAAYTETRDEMGRKIAYYDGIRLLTIGDKQNSSNPIIPNSHTSGGLTLGTDIYAFRSGLDGLCAITPEGDNIVDVYLPDFNAPGAVKTGEVEMVAGLALKATKAAGVLRNIKIV